VWHFFHVDISVYKKWLPLCKQTIIAMNRVVLIGAGNLATSLAYALKIHGCSVVQVYSRTMKSAKALADKVDAEAIDSFGNIVTDASYYFVALPDDAILQVAEKLPKLNGIVAHTSGSTPMSVLNRVQAPGFGVFYPFQTFSREKVIPFNNIPICLEASDEETYTKLELLAQKISDIVEPMNSEQRRWLHLTGVFACNFTNHMLSHAYRITAMHNIDFNIVKPLVLETISKAFEGNPADYQTGPAIRYDSVTLRRHAEMLKEFGLDELYNQLSLSIQKLAQNRKL
jgi:predicted short-subunit dehydrogenase-like oxidoreductase (DUF2520 family)